MITFKDLIAQAMKQVALDLGCSSEDFQQTTNTFSVSALSEGRRMFTRERDFFRIASFGDGAVVAGHEYIADWCRKFLFEMDGIRCFDSEGIYRINDMLSAYGMRLGYLSEYYLPVPPITGRNISFPLEWYEAADIPKLYGDKRFGHALMYGEEELRKDILAVSTLVGNDIAGVAGASEDSQEFWQIGIDVLPPYRSRGIAASLVTALTKEILDRGKVSYYGTWWSNIASRKVALASGYAPAWVEMTAIRLR